MPEQITAPDPLELPKSLLLALTSGRQAIGSPSNRPNRLFTPRDHNSPDLAPAVEAQVEQIISHRFGDLAPFGYDLKSTRVNVACCCGETFYMARRTLVDHLLRSHTPQYYRPYGSNNGLPSPKPPKGGYVCPHITGKLTEAFPAHFEVWETMRKAVCRNRANIRLQATPRWFERATGLAHFIIDTGLPEDPDLELRHNGKRLVYTPETYAWRYPEQKVDSASTQHRELYNRFYSLRHYATRTRRYFAWETFAEFLADVGYPANEEGEDLSQWRLTWTSPSLRGYTRNNFQWVPAQKEDFSQAPWNREAQAIEAGQALLFTQLGLSFEQYTQALINWGMMIADCSRTGDYVEDLFEEAIEMAKGGV